MIVQFRLGNLKMQGAQLTQKPAIRRGRTSRVIRLTIGICLASVIDVSVAGATLERGPHPRRRIPAQKPPGIKALRHIPHAHDFTKQLLLDLTPVVGRRLTHAIGRELQYLGIREWASFVNPRAARAAQLVDAIVFAGEELGDHLRDVPHFILPTARRPADREVLRAQLRGWVLSKRYGVQYLAQQAALLHTAWARKTRGSSCWISPPTNSHYANWADFALFLQSSSSRENSGVSQLRHVVGQRDACHTAINSALYIVDNATLERLFENTGPSSGTLLQSHQPVISHHIELQRRKGRVTVALQRQVPGTQFRATIFSQDVRGLFGLPVRKYFAAYHIDQAPGHRIDRSILFDDSNLPSVLGTASPIPDLF